MTFTKQTAGIPLTLVQQGWRLRATRETDMAWRAISLAHRWNYRLIQQTDGNYLELSQPVIEVAEGIRVYAHQGWGEGLVPTPEMVKVWEWWWFGTCPTCITEGVLSPDDFLAIRSTQWRGPVLPPVMP